jgi:MSHA biogenesis protein MshK
MAALWGLPVEADVLVDPTLPPAVLAAPDASGSAAAGPVLQSVMMGTGRKAAMISGQMVAVGEKFGDATLLRVTETSAVLRNPDMSLQTLQMHPAVEKKVTIQKPEGKSVTRTSKP